ncbi:MAG: hypothetical protein M1839_002383 [Geoglossum umbratile]|nr:MAG: hypothetical protein M1839_002383 [Geoglossum umbratile]
MGHLKALFRSCPHALVRMSKVVAGGRRMTIYADFWLLLMRSVSSGQSLNLDFEFACTLSPTVDVWDSDFEAGGPVLGLGIEDIPSPDGFVDGVVPSVGIRNATTLDSDADEAMDGVNTFNALAACPFSPDTAVRILVYGRYDFPNLASVVDGSPQLAVDAEVRTTLGFVRDVIRGRLELQPSVNLRLFCYGIGLSYHGSEALECWQLLSPTGLEAWPLVLVVFYDFGEGEAGNPDS